MTIHARSLVVAAGLVLSLSFALAASDDHAKPTPPAKHEDAHAKAPEAPAAKPASKAKPSIWDTAKSKGKAAEKPAEKATDEHAEDAQAKPETNDDHAPAAAHGKPSEKATKPATKPSSKHAEKAETKDEAKTPAAHDEPAAAITADAALTLLTEGNQRWVSGKPINPSIDADRREDLAANGQHPFATVLTCADSRIPLERVFDRGVGEVFTIRVAGNVAGDSETGTIEYGVGHLKTNLLVVMGHTKCGAVAAACSGAEVHGKVAGLIQHVTPAVERVKRNNPGADSAQIASLAERENVWQSVYDLLKNSQEVREKVAHNEIKVVGALYDIASGKVEFLGEHPWQSELVAAMSNIDAHAGSTMTVVVEGDEAQSNESGH